MIQEKRYLCVQILTNVCLCCCLSATVEGWAGFRILNKLLFSFHTLLSFIFFKTALLPSCHTVSVESLVLKKAIFSTFKNNLAAVWLNLKYEKIMYPRRAIKHITTPAFLLYMCVYELCRRISCGDRGSNGFWVWSQWHFTWLWVTALVGKHGQTHKTNKHHPTALTRSQDLSQAYVIIFKLAFGCPLSLFNMKESHPNKQNASLIWKYAALISSLSHRNTENTLRHKQQENTMVWLLYKWLIKTVFPLCTAAVFGRMTGRADLSSCGRTLSVFPEGEEEVVPSWLRITSNHSSGPALLSSTSSSPYFSNYF